MNTTPSGLQYQDTVIGEGAERKMIPQPMVRELCLRAALEVAGELERQGAARATHPVILVEGRTFREDHRQRRQRDHVVDHRRLAEETLDRGQRRTEPHFGTLAFQTLEQRGFLAADIGARAHANLDPEGRQTLFHKS